MSGLSGLFKKASEKASDVLQNLRIGDSIKFPGKEGDIIYSKNNVCIHPPIASETATEPSHVPGYLTLHCQRDETLGITLILQWLPNATLEKNPRSIRTMSPRLTAYASPKSRVKLRHLEGDQKKRRRRSSSESSSPVQETSESHETSENENDEAVKNIDVTLGPRSNHDYQNISNPQISVEMSGENLTVVTQDTVGGGSKQPRPQLFLGTLDDTLSAPSINVIPNTPTPTMCSDVERFRDGFAAKDQHQSASADKPRFVEGRESPVTSGADDGSDDDHRTILTGEPRSATNENKDEMNNSSPYSSGDDPNTPLAADDQSDATLLTVYRNTFDYWRKTPEEFAQLHNMILPDGVQDDEKQENGVHHTAKNISVCIGQQSMPSLFSVDLGRMRSFRLFYSNPEYSCGQLVIASPRSQYKILHFHNGGLDKLSQIFEQWSAVRSKSKKGNDSPFLSQPGRQFAILKPLISKSEQHPEEGLYEKVTWEFWRSCTNSQGAIQDDLTLRKAIFFAGLDSTLRREAWPFLLLVYPWNSTYEQREQIRNDLFLEYQNIRKRRLKGALKMGAKVWSYVESTIAKDVVRTDRRNPYFKGEENPNVEKMRNVLLNYAAFCPQIGYIQGMSDLLAAILLIVQEESDSFWCFAGLMQRTIFVSAPRNDNNMDKNLEYLRCLLKVMNSEFYLHLCSLGGDALQLLFTHRWILLCFKREFVENDSLRIWESCWANYQTSYFHLFVCLAITIVYGEDVVMEKLPHDEILFHFSSLAMHMNADTVLKKARGLLYQFERYETIPCTLSGVCNWQSVAMWDAGHQHPDIVCVHTGESETCPYIINDGS